MRHSIIAFAITALTTIVNGQELPDGPGKAAVQKVCTDCHGLATVIGVRRTRDDWDKTIDEMTSRGATGTDEEFDTILAYLSKYFGKVNVNKAKPEEIQEIVGLSTADAEAIVRYRAANGDFKDMGDLRKIPNIDAKKLEERKDRIAFQ